LVGYLKKSRGEQIRAKVQHAFDMSPAMWMERSCGRTARKMPKSDAITSSFGVLNMFMMMFFITNIIN